MNSDAGRTAVSAGVLRRRHAVAGGLALLVCGSPVVRAATREVPVIDSDVRTAVAQGTTRVLVELRLPVPGGSSPSGAASTREQAIAAARQSVLARLAGRSHRLVRQYPSVPLLALEIGADALRALEEMGDRVVRVRVDRIRPPTALA
jgi:hypothetical protein